MKQGNTGGGKATPRNRRRTPSFLEQGILPPTGTHRYDPENPNVFVREPQPPNKSKAPHFLAAEFKRWNS